MDHAVTAIAFETTFSITQHWRDENSKIHAMFRIIVRLLQSSRLQMADRVLAVENDIRCLTLHVPALAQQSSFLLL